MSNLTRRGFVKCGAAVATIAAAHAGGVVADELPLVDENGAQAMALGYRHDATTVDTAKFANYVEGSSCSGCQLFSGGDAEEGPCAIFPGHQVKATGWCSAWAKRVA